MTLKYTLTRKGALYDMLSTISRKPKQTIVTYFWRNRLNIENSEHYLKYIKKYGKD